MLWRYEVIKVFFSNLFLNASLTFKDLDLVILGQGFSLTTKTCFAVFSLMVVTLPK